MQTVTHGISAMVIIMMGVSGSGKTTVGKLLASALHLPFLDADDLHPAENVEKMRRGIPLKDHDRESWLRTVAGKIVEFGKSGGGVIACSALKKIPQDPFFRLKSGCSVCLSQRRPGYHLQADAAAEYSFYATGYVGQPV